MRTVLYTWNLEQTQLGRLRYFCLRQGIQLRPVGAAECSLPIRELPDRPAEAAAAEERLPFDTPMLLMAGFSPAQVDGLLAALKGIPPAVPLKAVLTAANRRWTGEQLHRELSAERAALGGA